MNIEKLNSKSSKETIRQTEIYDENLKKKSNEIRNKILDMSIASGGHIASSLSCVDILVSLYYGGVLRFNPKKPEWNKRDRFILSKGHAEMALYAILADLGFFSYKWINNCYRQGECHLGGHPDFSIPGVEISSGSLGHGLGIGAGISLSAKMDGEKHIQYVLMGDAECTEGVIWETALFASKHELENLIAIIDRNHISALEHTEDFTNLEPFLEKWKAFGWDAIAVDGHSCMELIMVLKKNLDRKRNKPLVIIAETVKGKGISFMENDPMWHVLSLNKKEDIIQAKKELKWE